MSVSAVRWFFGLLITAIGLVGGDIIHSVRDSGIKDQKIEDATKSITDLQTQVGVVRIVPDLSKQVEGHTQDLKALRENVTSLQGDVRETNTNIKWMMRSQGVEPIPPPTPAKKP